MSKYYGTTEKKDRNDEIVRRYVEEFDSIRTLADDYGLSPLRIRQILDKAGVRRTKQVQGAGPASAA
jgi:hypothetical protein